jgi:hypothetical protein
MGAFVAATSVLVYRAAFALYKENSPVPASASKVGNTAVLVQCILKFLPEEKILAAERVNKNWKRWASSNAVWKYPCDREGIPPIRRLGKGAKIEKLFYKAAYQHLYPIIFGPKQYFDDLHVKIHGNKTRLADTIHETVDRLDPADQKKIRLIYLPREIERTNSEGKTSVARISPNLLGELVQAVGVRNPMKYVYVWQEFLKHHGNVPLESSRWFLMSTEFVRADQKTLDPERIKVLSALGNRLPTDIEAIALIFFNRVRFGTYLLDPYEFCCTSTTVMHMTVPHPIYVGGVSSLGLTITQNVIDIIGTMAAFSCESPVANETQTVEKD